MVGVRHQTIFAPTNRNSVTWLKVSPWWSEQAMRRSLLTALLRASQIYIPAHDNFEESLWSCRYLKHTQAAVKRFLSGYTWYTGRVCGWDRQFRYVTSEQLKKLLVKPTRG
jgi:hypothetical protein